MFSDVTFAYPWMFYFLAVIPLMIFWYWKTGMRKETSIIYSSLKIFEGMPVSWKERLRHVPIVLRCLAIAFLIIALARPQSFSSGQNVTTEGIDVVMALDISGSMVSEDLKPNRVQAVKNVVEKFIENRPNDRIGLVVFSREAFTQCPITIDHSVLINLLKKIGPGMVPDGTAIGNGIADAVGRLKDSKAKSKVIILLTDGENNAGEIDPLTAADIAKAYGIRVYTIGAGTEGEAPYPVQTPFGVRYQMMPSEVDEPLLKNIAQITGGMFFRATDNTALNNIYYKIDKLEKTKIEVTSYRNAAELFSDWLNVGFILILLELILSKTVFKKIP
ncbi:MAG: VWA domain-containing protein [Ignavibacteriaceae bacterium]|jgi:Ca-activated chloride channel family protein